MRNGGIVYYDTRGRVFLGAVYRSLNGLHSSRVVVFLVHGNNYLPYPLVRHWFTRVDRPSRVFSGVEAARKISDICQAYIKSNKTAGKGKRRGASVIR